MIDVVIKEYDYKDFKIYKNSKKCYSVYYGLFCCGCYTSLKRSKDIINMLIKICIDYYMSFKPQCVINKIVEYRHQYNKEVIF